MSVTCPLAQAQGGHDHLEPRVPALDNPGQIFDTQSLEEEYFRDAQVLVDSLDDLVVTNDPDSLVGTPTEKGVSVDLGNLIAPEKLSPALQRFLGEPITLVLLDEINREIVRFAQANDYPIVDAFAPEGQDITEGVVQILVLIAQRGDVRVVDRADKNLYPLTRHSVIESGDVITESALRTELEWLNRNPFRRIDLILERGEQFGQTDIIYDVKRRARPYRLYGGIEDSGSRLAGKERWFAGFNWGDVFGWDHQFNYQFTSALDSRQVTAHSFGYVAPLPWRHELRLSGAFVQSVPELNDPSFRTSGETSQFGLRYHVPLRSTASLTHEMALGFDYKRSDNDLEFGGLRVSDTTTVVSHFLLDYSASHIDAYGKTSGNLSLVYSPGNMLGHNSDRAFASARFDASADYTYATFALQRETWFANDWRWLVELGAQMATENLLGSEQYGLGGYRTVRGYDDFEVAADNALFARSEIHTPPVGVLRAFSSLDVPDRLHGLVFMDYGRGESVKPLPGEKALTLWSAGVGLRYVVADYLSMRLDYGWQLRNLTVSAVDDGRAHFALFVTY